MDKAELATLAKAFAEKRKSFLAEHAAKFDSEACGLAYAESERAWDDFMESFGVQAADHPDALAALFNQ